MGRENVLQLKLNRPALDRLIGNDKDIELVLTDAAIKEVLEKRMKLVNGVVQKAADEALGTVDFRGKFVLNNRTNLLIAEHLQKGLAAVVAVEVEKFLREHATEIQELVQKEVEKQLESSVRSAVVAAKDALIRKITKE